MKTNRATTLSRGTNTYGKIMEFKPVERDVAVKKR